jgi:hypothetical protein
MVIKEEIISAHNNNILLEAIYKKIMFLEMRSRVKFRLVEIWYSKIVFTQAFFRINQKWEFLNKEKSIRVVC